MNYAQYDAALDLGDEELDRMTMAALDLKTNELREGLQYVLARGLAAIGYAMPLAGTHEVMRAAICEALAHRKGNGWERLARENARNVHELLDRVVSAEEALRAFNITEKGIVGGTADSLTLRVPIATIKAAAAHFAKFSDPLPPAGSQWQPIESAPKDGTRILLADKRSVVTGMWNEQIPGWQCDWLVGTWGDKPKFWMPLPLPDPPPLPSDGGA